jgi:hypothetical protein
MKLTMTCPKCKKDYEILEAHIIPEINKKIDIATSAGTVVFRLQCGH